MTYELFIIDAISPFFVKHPEVGINWSKIPFDQIESNGKLKKKRYLRIKKDFERFIDQISEIGYNAISMDDLCHLAVLDIYNPILQKKIKKYRKRYKKLFKYAKQKNLKIYVTTDIMFFNDDIRSFTGCNLTKMIGVMNDAITQVFNKLPDVDGFIFRMGESDGVDVTGDFLSSLVIKTPKDVFQFISQTLPVFEQYNKQLIFRNWTVGINPVGDLIWNHETYHKCFHGINSQNFIISMKHGEGDFFRFLELNPAFLNDTQHKKLLEIQSRREYEGFGQYPVFVGWEYERLKQQLAHCDTLIGINVWCQTGGWSKTRSFSFLNRSSFFNELNTSVVLSIFKYDMSVAEAVEWFCPDKNQARMMQFLKYADDVIYSLLYMPEFASQSLYFNRVRIPSLLYVFWHFVTLTGPVINVFRLYCKDLEKSLVQAETAYNNIQQMALLNESLMIDYNHQYYQDTFELFIQSRRILFMVLDKDIKGDRDIDKRYQQFQKQYQSYFEKYPDGYQFLIKPPSKYSSLILKWLIPVFVRQKKQYRWYDRLLFSTLTSMVYRLFSVLLRKNLPEFVDKKAMPIEKLLR